MGGMKKNLRGSRVKREFFSVGAVSGHAMPLPRTPPPKPATVIIVNRRRLFEPFVSDFFKARKAGARGRHELKKKRAGLALKESFYSWRRFRPCYALAPHAATKTGHGNNH